MKIPQTAAVGDTSTDPLEGIALNQLIPDKQIIDTIVSNAFGSKRWSSAIKIGDIWLSIPSRIISIYDSYETNPEEYWKDPRDLPDSRIKVLKDLGITKANPVSKDPLEKFTGYNMPLIENSVIGSESLGRLTNLVVQNNKSADKLFVLKFECNALSIQNNIRPIMAQALLSPFLPIQNCDINQIVNPPDENPELFLNSNKAFIDPNTGQFKWGSLGTNTSVDESKLSPIALTNYKKYVTKTGISSQDQTTLQQELLRLRAYWELPFYIQLIDFSIKSLPEKRNAYELMLTVRPVSLEPAYGEIPQFIKTDESLKKQISSNDILQKNYKGDTKLIRNISKMLGLNPNDENQDFKYNSERKDYNLFDSRFDTQVNEIVDTTNPLSHAVTFKINTDRPFPFLNKNSKYITSAGYIDSVQFKNNSVINNLNKKLIFNKPQSEISCLIEKLDPVGFPTGAPKVNIYSNINKLNLYNLNNTTIKSITSTSKNTYKFQLTPKVKSENGTVQTDFKLIQYNLKQFFKPGTDVSPSGSTNTGYELRKALFGKFLTKQNADIICLEELGNTDYSISELKQYIEDLSGISYNVFHKSNTTAVTSGNLNQTIGVGLLSKIPGIAEEIDLRTKIDKYLNNQKKFSESKVIQENTNLSLSINYNTQIPDSRPILKVTLTRPEDASNLVVFVCHFRSKLKTDNEYFRKFESFCLIDEILSLPKDQPYIIVGDFNYDLYSLESIDLSSFNNNIFSYDKNKKTFEHKFRTISENGEIDKAAGENLSPLWYGTLDLIVSEDRETISENIDLNTPGIINVNTRIQKYYENLYFPLKYSEIVERVLVFSSLKEKYKAKTKTEIENFKLLGNPKNLNSINPKDQSGTGTFFNVEKATEDPSDITSMGFSIIDNIFYSRHFFKNGSLNYLSNQTEIINKYDDKAKYSRDPKLSIDGKIIEIPIPDRGDPALPPLVYFKRCVVPEKESKVDFFKKTQYSDHFPVSTSFKWNIVQPSNNDTTIDPLEKVKQSFFTGSKLPTTVKALNPTKYLGIFQSGPTNFEAESEEIEIFPYPNANVQKLKEFSDIFGGAKTAQDLILYKNSNSSTVRTILGIFYSNIVNNYVFIYTNIDKNTNELIPYSIENTIVEVDILEKYIKDLYSGNLAGLAIESICSILESEITGETINLENLDILTNIPTKDIGEKIEKSTFYQYYNLLDNYNEISLSPGEVSTNISQCQPFRNYYLPLLEEFSDEVRKFDWKYNFEIDKFGSFIFNTKNVNQEDYKLYFSRKSPNRFGSTFIYSVTRAIQILARFNSGEPATSLAKYLGDIANTVLYNSERLTAKANRLMAIKNCTKEQALNILINNDIINGEIPIGGSKFSGNYQTTGVVTRNVVSAEIIYYLATQIGIILTLIDESFRDEIVNTTTAGIDPVLDSLGNVIPLEKYKDKMYKEIKFRANVFFQNQPVNYTKYVKTIERYLKINNIKGVDEPINGNPNPSNQKKYLTLNDLIKDYRKDLDHMINKIYDLYVNLKPIKIIEAI